MSKVDGYRLSLVGFTFLGKSYSEMDCQAFVEACLKACGCTLNLKGSNAWYRQMTWTGTPEECRKRYGKIPRGAFLFILDDGGGEIQRGYHDGLGDATHIGIYTGTGKGSIHSSKSAGKVIESEFNGKSIRGFWNRVGLWDNVSYEVDIAKGSGEGEKKLEKVTISGGNVDKPINMRPTASTAKAVIALIPQGSEAELLEGGGEWNQIRWGNFTGYVKSEFVHAAGEADGSGKFISVPQKALEEIYDKLGDWLGLRG